MAGVVNISSRTRNRPAAIDRFETTHDPSQILGGGQITARQFTQRTYAVLAVVNRLEIIAAEQLRQLTSIDAVTLIPQLSTTRSSSDCIPPGGQHAVGVD